jgi:hypothetical protein
VGIDVERTRPMRDLLEVAQRYFAPPEARSLKAMLDADRVSRFAELWTLKESYIKATGNGFAAPLDRFAFDLSHLPTLCFSAEDDDPCRWHFMLAAPTSDTRLAVAVEGGARAINFRRVHGATAIASGDALRVIAESPPRTAVVRGNLDDVRRHRVLDYTLGEREERSRESGRC